jgi:hypothetical protein
LLCSGCLLSDDEREPISLKSMQQQQEWQHASLPLAAAAAACQHATCSSNSSSRSSTGSSFMLLRSTCARDGCMRAYVVCMRMLRVYVGACVSGCSCIHVFAHNTIAWMCKFKSCVCMYVCTTHMRMACARACMRCACSQKAIVNVKTFNCLYMNVCVHIRMCVRMRVCLYVHACMYMRRVRAHRKKIDLMYTFHCLCVHVRVHVCACVSLLCMCARACVCMRNVRFRCRCFERISCPQPGLLQQPRHKI